ncbi:MAG: hypothetical protein JG782_398 [Anaerophaga sp.]|nr:hypothetical protein [Anaerophaga sp.]
MVSLRFFSHVQILFLKDWYLLKIAVLLRPIIIHAKQHK